MVRARARDLERFQSMLPVGGATITIVCPCLLITVSIHALRGESDDLKITKTVLKDDFNPRSPWGERPAGPPPGPGFSEFNPRSPWGERHKVLAAMIVPLEISIHALRGESDIELQKDILGSVFISIHALRGESDSKHIQNAAWRFG